MEEEKAIELAEEFTKMDFNNPTGWTGYYDSELNELSLAIKTVLNIIKERDKRIKELEEEKKNSIPKQKIKDKIKELANIKGDFATYIATSERIKVLEELLEEK